MERIHKKRSRSCTGSWRRQEQHEVAMSLRAPKDLFKEGFLAKRRNKRNERFNSFAPLVLFPLLLSLLPDYIYFVIALKPNQINDLLRAIAAEPAIKLETWIQFFAIISFLGVLVPLFRWFSDRGGDATAVSGIFRSDDSLRRVSGASAKWRRTVEDSFVSLSSREYRSVLQEIDRALYRRGSQHSGRILDAAVVSLLFYWALVLPLWDLLIYFALAREVKYGVSVLVCLIFIGILAWLYALTSDFLEFTYFRMSRLSVSAQKVVDYLELMDGHSFSYRSIVEKWLRKSMLPRWKKKVARVYLLGASVRSPISIILWSGSFIIAVGFLSFCLDGLSWNSPFLAIFFLVPAFVIVLHFIYLLRVLFIDVLLLGKLYLFLIAFSFVGSFMVSSFISLMAVLLGMYFKYEWNFGGIVVSLFAGFIIGAILAIIYPIERFEGRLNLQFEKALFFSVDRFFLALEESGCRSKENQVKS